MLNFTKSIVEAILLNCYNKAADKMNNGIIEDFNKHWDESGKDYETDEYVEAYEEVFRGVMQPIVDKAMKWCIFSVKIKDEVLTLKDTKNGTYEPIWHYDIFKK